MWSSTLIEELDEDMHLFLDGVARSKPEAELLTTAFEFYSREKPTVIYLNVSRRWSEEKLLARGRMDDSSLVHIDARLNWFDKDTMPAIEYFRKNPFFHFERHFFCHCPFRCLYQRRIARHAPLFDF